MRPPERVRVLAFLLALGAVFTSADGMCQADFPAAVPDRPGGFMIFHEGNVYSFALKTWNQSPERYFETSRLFNSLEKGVEERELRVGAVSGQEFHTVSKEGRHQVVQEFAAHGFVYEFSVLYSGARPQAFFDSIRFSDRLKDPSRVRLIQCALILDGLASQRLDRRPWPQDVRCPAGGVYHLQENGRQFSIFCDGDHGLGQGYPRIDQTREILEGAEKPLPRPDL